MNKKTLQLLLRVIVSATFLFLVFRKIDFRMLYVTVRGCYLPLAVVSIAIAVLLSFLLSARWLVLLKGQTNSGRIRFLSIWKLTMIGQLFNNFLPTGAGGDIAKVFYLVRGEENKLLLGSSVLIDRFIGALTVITMGVLAALFTATIPLGIRYLLSLILLFLLFILVFFSNRKIASPLYSGVRRIFPGRMKETMENTYNVFNRYFSARRWLLAALGLSFLMQSISIFTNYLMTMSLLWGKSSMPGINLFFIYIPLIWASTMVPSLGGLGIREFTYVYFFSGAMGKENAFALSAMFLISVLIQSIIGAFIMLLLKER